MDPYDSDSSGLEDDGDYTETGVLLGYSSAEPTGDFVSQLGGWPSWLDPSSPPPGSYANCKVCSNPMALLLQLNGDLPEHFPNDERRLYIFGCSKKTCARKSGSVRALRGVKKHKSQKPQGKRKEDGPSSPKDHTKAQTISDLGSSLFNATGNGPSSNPNPFSTSASSSAAQSNPFAPLPAASTLAAKPPQKPSSPMDDLPETFADKVRVSSPTPSPTPEPAEPSTPWPSESSFPSPYTHYHLDAEYETLSRPATPSLPSSTKIDVEDLQSTSATGDADTKDAFESSLDKSFLRFSARLEHNPEQVLRYEFRGTPILYSTTDAVGKLFSPPSSTTASHIKVSSSANSTSRIPRCESCGRERVFELQLVPHAISVLEEGRGIGLGAKDDAGMEWGTVVLGVCAGDCGSQTEEQGGEAVGWREEWIGVQWEERG